MLRQGRAEALAVGDSWLIAMITYGLGVATLALGDPGGAQEWCEESLRVCQDAGDRQGIAANLAILGQLARMRGAATEAFHLFTSALQEFQRMGDRDNVCTCMESLAGVLVNMGHPEPGARLFGAAAAARQRIGTPLPLREQEHYMADLAAAQKALHDIQFQTAWQAGENTPLPALLAGLAHEQEKAPSCMSGSVPHSEPSPATHLTKRERQVLELVSSGLTDREIGIRLSISPETVTKHVGNVLGKLGVRSRTAAAVLLIRSSL